MAEQVNLDQAKLAIEGGMTKAQEILDDPAKIDSLLAELQEKTKDLPGTVGSALVNIPTMASMVKSYVTKEYTEISPKVIVSVVSAFLYLVKGRDIIPDSIPIVGMLDDVAVITVAMKLCEPELEAFKQWQKTGVVSSSTSAADIIDTYPIAEA